MAQQDTPAASSGKKLTAKHVDAFLHRSPCSIGQIEALAGVNPQNEAERQELWQQFSHLYALPNHAAMNAVMLHCKAIAAKRANAGELTLWNPIIKVAA